MGEKICLTLLNGSGYVFEVDDYMRLRRDHHIVGCLVGTTTEAHSATNKFRLPAELTRDETRLLIEKGIAKLLSKEPSLLRAPTPAELAKYEENVKDKLAEQAEMAKIAKLQNTQLNIDKVLEGKRKKLEKEGAKTAAHNLTAADVLTEIEQNFVFDAENALIEIPCAHTAAADAGTVVSLPTFTPSDELKYRVFCDFWQRGKYVTPGDAFGADFLIYPGDPLIYHASHIVIVLNKQPAAITLLDLVTKVRLAVIVNKICILAYAAKPTNNVDDVVDNIEVHYQTIEWDGNLEQQQMKTTAENSSNEFSKIS